MQEVQEIQKEWQVEGEAGSATVLALRHCPGDSDFQECVLVRYVRECAQDLSRASVPCSFATSGIKTFT